MVGVGSTTLAQHCPYVNILSLAVGLITSWNQYVGPTLGQCTPVACFNTSELRLVHNVGQHWTNVCLPLWFLIKVVENATLTVKHWANVHRWLVLTWPSCVGCISLGQKLDQRMPANLVLDKSLLKILVCWPNIWPMHTGGLILKHDLVVLYVECKC